jgi:hypothetical protein
MAFDRFTDVSPKLVEVVGLGENGFTQCLSDVTAFRRVFDNEDYFFHAEHLFAVIPAAFA